MHLVIYMTLYGLRINIICTNIGYIWEPKLYYYH